MSSTVRIYVTILAALVVAGGGLAIVSYFVSHEKDTAITSQPQTRQSYVALGDSVAAGVGLMNDSDSSACNRTDQSYPRQLANTGRYQLTNLACSGATLAAGINGPQVVNQLSVASQVKQLFALPRPDLVTLTVGANDAGWTQFIATCYDSRVTCDTPDQNATIKQRLVDFQAGLRQTLQALQDHYGSKPVKLLLTGYYQVFPANTATCSDVIGVDFTEQQWVRQQLDALNAAISSSVKAYSFATYVPLNFDGHELCSTISWIQGISDKQPYHPTADGQAVIANQLKDKR
jgi:lysophospholipase L1-like esterase